MKKKFSEKSTLSKSVQPILIGLALVLLAFVAYKAYVAIDKGLRYSLALWMQNTGLLVLGPCERVWRRRVLQ
jgi:hypothetical protein